MIGSRRRKRLRPTISGSSRSPYPSSVSSRRNWSTSRRRCVRIRTPTERAASTKPGGGDRLARRRRVAEPVAADGAGIRPRGVLVVLLGSISPSLELVVVVLVLVERGSACRSVAVPVLALVRGDQLGEHPGERVDLMAAELGAGGEVRRLLASTRSRPSMSAKRTFHSGVGCSSPASISAIASSSARRRAVPVASTTPGSSPSWRKGSPAQAAARSAEASRPSRPGRGFRRIVDGLLHARSTRRCRYFEKVRPRNAAGDCSKYNRSAGARAVQSAPVSRRGRRRSRTGCAASPPRPAPRRPRPLRAAASRAPAPLPRTPRRRRRTSTAERRRALLLERVGELSRRLVRVALDANLPGRVALLEDSSSHVSRFGSSSQRSSSASQCSSFTPSGVIAASSSSASTICCAWCACGARSRVDEERVVVTGDGQLVGRELLREVAAPSSRARRRAARGSRLRARARGRCGCASRRSPYVFKATRAPPQRSHDRHTCVSHV